MMGKQFVLQRGFSPAWTSSAKVVMLMDQYHLNKKKNLKLHKVCGWKKYLCKKNRSLCQALAL